MNDVNGWRTSTSAAGRRHFTPLTASSLLNCHALKRNFLVMRLYHIAQTSPSVKCLKIKIKTSADASGSSHQYNLQVEASSLKLDRAAAPAAAPRV